MVVQPVTAEAPDLSGTQTGATTPSTETITITREKPGGVPAGWTASGLFSDSGTNPGWTEGKFICGACPSPVAFAGIFYETATSDATGDTINLRYVIAASPPNESDLCFIEGGTGGYANLRGQGTFTFVNNGPTSPLDIVCTAQVQMS